jgi:adenylyltransferase/sulfurtransferase
VEQLAGRYARQILLPEIGAVGQERIGAARIAVVGLGALGTVAASYLARAGAGNLLLVDRDLVEESNLQRQSLYDEEDAREGTPKAIAAHRRLARVNSRIRIRPVVAHLGPENAASILSDVDLILDGTDNLETRFLINDLALARGIPWIYAACAGCEGLVSALRPGTTFCLRCLFEPNRTGGDPTCDSEGILGPVAGLAASVQAGWALLLLAGRADAVPRGILRLDPVRGSFPLRFRDIAPRPDCPACGQGRLEFLRGNRAAAVRVLCGPDTIQILPAAPASRDLDDAERSLARHGEVRRNRYLLRARVEDCTLSLFPDGRVIVAGTRDPTRARSLVDRYLGGA